MVGSILLSIFIKDIFVFIRDAYLANVADDNTLFNLFFRNT